MTGKEHSVSISHGLSLQNKLIPKSTIWPFNLNQSSTNDSIGD